MEFGFDIPSGGPMATPENIAMLARKGEELGFDIISVSDHIVIPKRIESRYPYGETGEWPPGADECLEMLTTLSFVAGQTSRARLLTSVMVLPHRNPVPTAKMLATVDVLSKGRLIVGCGVGWMREEFEVIGAPPYEERGAVGDEYLQAFKELWTSENPSFEGKYCRFSNLSFLPRPVQKPHPPIWIGGESPPALRRTARLGNGWFPIGNNPRHTVETTVQLGEYLSRLRGYAQEAGRDPSEIDVAYAMPAYSLGQAQLLSNGDRRPFTGTAQQIADDAKAFEEMGVRHLMLGYSLEEGIPEQLERFADQVRPLL
ncbi:MAG: LLM class F420-dependent oxidoreductase [Dehalococcoidia bacterium]